MKMNRENIDKIVESVAIIVCILAVIMTVYETVVTVGRVFALLSYEPYLAVMQDTPEVLRARAALESLKMFCSFYLDLIKWLLGIPAWIITLLTLRKVFWEGRKTKAEAQKAEKEKEEGEEKKHLILLK